MLHDWDDVAAAAILRRAAEAAGSDGRVVVVERTGAERAPTAMDLRLLVWFGGRERSVRELAALAGGVGLRHVATGGADGIAVLELAPG